MPVVCRASFRRIVLYRLPEYSLPPEVRDGGREDSHSQQQEEHAADSREGAAPCSPGVRGDDESGREYDEAEFPSAERNHDIQPGEEGERTPGQQADGRGCDASAGPSRAEERPSGDVHVGKQCARPFIYNVQVRDEVDGVAGRASGSPEGAAVGRFGGGHPGPCTVFACEPGKPYRSVPHAVI